MRAAIEILLLLVVITQVIIPAFIPGISFFWIFKFKSVPKTGPTMLDELKEQAEEASSKMKNAKEEIKKTEEKLNDIKSKTNI